MGPSKKKIILSPQNDKSGCILTQFLTGRKHGQSLWDTVYRSIAKQAYKNNAKIIEKFTVRPGAVAPSPPPEYATDQTHTALVAIVC